LLSPKNIISYSGSTAAQKNNKKKQNRAYVALSKFKDSEEKLDNIEEIEEEEEEEESLLTNKHVFASITNPAPPENVVTTICPCNGT
jgi:hypothetical protein